MKHLLEPLRECLAHVVVGAWRLHLDTPGVWATVPLLRGVWGAALHNIDPALYQAVFEGGEEQTPRYILRPAPPEARPAPAVDFLLWGSWTVEAEEKVWAVWEQALWKGLGPRRQTARLVSVVPLAWDGTPLQPARRQPGFALHPLPWAAGDPEGPCKLIFPAPLRLLREGRLISAPTLADLTIALLRRLRALEPGRSEAVWSLRGAWLELARMQPADPWMGLQRDLVRYSARQQQEVELRGVSGELSLPRGPGLLADLLAAATWLHLGKGVVMGLGQMLIHPTGCQE